MATTGFLTTHVLDTANGVPAKGMTIELFKVSEGELTLLKTMKTNDDGRTDEQILPSEEFELGEYELRFFTKEYFQSSRSGGKAKPFLSMVPLRFHISEEDHYHVPLLVSPFSYSTYRGS